MIRFLLLSLIISTKAFSTEFSFMGCNWNIPSDFTSNGASWVSKRDHKDYIIHFTVEPELIKHFENYTVDDDSVENYIVVENANFKASLLAQVLFGSTLNAYPLWILIEHHSYKGLLIMNTLSNKQIKTLVNNCIPELVEVLSKQNIEWSDPSFEVGKNYKRGRKEIN